MHIYVCSYAKKNVQALQFFAQTYFVELNHGIALVGFFLLMLIKKLFFFSDMQNFEVFETLKAVS